ncbi:hypothetical protein ACHMW5_02375 [Azospirillum melinis]|uniref:hypothetical protein n=1 Tax=Azospirillum melinis TaxID=328839 RepID=UPI0037567578
MNQRTGLTPESTQKFAFTGSAARTTDPISTKGDGVVLVRLWASTDCHVSAGPGTPSATTSDIPLSAGVPEFFLWPGSWKVSAIRQTADGSLWVTTCRSGSEG